MGHILLGVTITMIVFHALVFLFGLGAAATAAVAALLWNRASGVSLNPAGGENSGEHGVQQDAWIAVLMEAYSESSRLNGKAARWSAIAALLGALAAVVALFLGG